MRAQRFFLLFFLSIFLATTAGGEPNLLATVDVRKVMDQLFEFHVDKKEMQPQLMGRSLKIFIDNFDSQHAYFISDEVVGYLSPSERTLSGMIDEYRKDQFSMFISLSELIQRNIYRARKWREEWSQNPKLLIEEAKTVEIVSTSARPFPTRLIDLKKRHQQLFLQLVAFQLKQNQNNLVDNKEEKIVAFCEKQLRLIENPYLGIGEQGEALTKKEKDHQVVQRILKAFAHSLDAHTAYYSPEEAFAMKVQLEKGMCGIGVVLHEGIEGVVIAEILKGSPAEKAGQLKVGDMIVEIDGTSVRDYSFRRILDVLRGSEGSKAVLGVMRSHRKDHLEFIRVELVRAKMTIDDKRVEVSYEPFGDGVVGKITLYSFYEGEEGISSEKDIRRAIDQLRAIGPLHGLVLDMRENSGGFLSQAVRVSGLFISSGVVVISKYADGTLKYYRSMDGSPHYQGPLVVLVSRGSASATEIVAQTLQDYGVALVAGDIQTYGKGTIQHQTVTSDRTSSFFKVTVGRYYTVSGKSTQIEGVKSDILIPTSLNFEEVGEAFLDYPLPADRVESAFDDPLTDVDLYARKWFTKYYLPTLQSKETVWRDMIGKLRINSEKRQTTNKNFQLFVKAVKTEKENEKRSFGVNDIQMEEAVNIVKDMIYFHALNEPREAVSVGSQ